MFIKSQKGFSIVEGLLILVIVGLLGGTGWYVWQSNNKTKSTLTAAETTSSSTVDSAKSINTPSEKIYENDRFKLKLPNGWSHVSSEGSLTNDENEYYKFAMGYENFTINIARYGKDAVADLFWDAQVDPQNSHMVDLTDSSTKFCSSEDDAFCSDSDGALTIFVSAVTADSPVALKQRILNQRNEVFVSFYARNDKSAELKEASLDDYKYLIENIEFKFVLKK